VTGRPKPDDLDRRYGLEPVFEPGNEAAGTVGDFVTVACPYCGERYGIAVDTSAGGQVQIEDCQICCQPIEFTSVVDDDGALRSIMPRRLD